MLGFCFNFQANDTESVFPEDLQAWGTVLSCDLLNQGKTSGPAVWTGIVSGLPTILASIAAVATAIPMVKDENWRRQSGIV